MWHRILSCISILALAGCSSMTQDAAPVVDISNTRAHTMGYHVVAQGESLYEIAWRYGKDYREVAQVNKILPPYQIYPGQKISLKKTKYPTGNHITRDERPHQRKPNLVVEFPQNTIAMRNKSDKDLNGTSKPIKQSGYANLNQHWQWPVQGKIIKRFAQGVGPKGIDIAGKVGDKIKTTGPGKVVYSGSGLRGYGQLVIIKHNDTYLSAYGHNSRLLVKEGDMITKDQDIAEMGTDGGQAKLHFEIRKNGLPIDPLNMLSAPIS